MKTRGAVWEIRTTHNRLRSLDRRPRFEFLDFQLDVLETTFKVRPKPGHYKRMLLACLTEIPEDRIQLWFRNRRAKARRANCENCPPEDVSSRAGFTPAAQVPNVGLPVPSIPQSCSLPLHQVQLPSFGLQPLHQVQPPSFGLQPPHQVQPPSFGLQPPHQVQPPSFGLQPLRQVQLPSFGLQPLHQVQPPSFGLQPLHQVQPPSFGLQPPHQVQPPSFGLQPPRQVQPPSFGLQPPHQVQAWNQHPQMLDQNKFCYF
ncbi:homeobox expressed in ES cells 1 [Podarcis lilfordi]|uniref:Homeobox expressed in ES cells 1 n=1 Tax=Podarcis lilfordi TaxID=74358 RepID=A0AA35P0T8_9SAUR|nr:homeobox expressed in ES cells 1 [Podarcis lilfordi]